MELKSNDLFRKYCKEHISRRQFLTKLGILTGTALTASSLIMFPGNGDNKGPQASRTPVTPPDIVILPQHITGFRIFASLG